MTSQEIQRALSSVGGGANKHLGQHFLIDPEVLQVMVEMAHTHPTLKTLEIGPGLGVLTKALVQNGHDVIAMERDRRFVGWLDNHVRAGLKPARTKDVGDLRLVPGDATTLDWERYIGKDEWQLISNLPYSISSFVLRTALYMPHPPEQIVVLVQREVAERVLAKKGKTSLLSLMVALAANEVEILRDVPPGCFFPPPKVHSAILRIVPRPLPERFKLFHIDPEEVMALAKKGFAHPRKLLASNLELDTQTRKILTEVGIAEKARAEDVSPEQWALLARALNGAKGGV